MRHLVLAVVLLAPATAHARGEAAAAKKLLAAQAQAMVAGPDEFAATFTADALVIFPSNVGAGSDDIRQRFIESFSDAHDEMTAAKPKNVKIGVLDGAAWVTAEVVTQWVGHGEGGETVDFQPVTYRLTELVVRDGDAWKARVAHFSTTMRDKDVKAGYALDLAAIPDAADDNPIIETLESPAALLAAVSKDKAVAVLGSAGEKAIGGARAKKLLKKWSKLSFHVVGGARTDSTDAWLYAVANVELESGGQKLGYRVLALFDGAGRLVSLHYSAAR